MMTREQVQLRITQLVALVAAAAQCRPEPDTKEAIRQCRQDISDTDSTLRTELAACQEDVKAEQAENRSLRVEHGKEASKVIDLQAQLAQLEQQLTQARDERNEFYNATVTLKGRLAHVEQERDELEAYIEIHRDDSPTYRDIAKIGMEARDVQIAELVKLLATAQARIKELEGR